MRKWPKETENVYILLTPSIYNIFVRAYGRSRHIYESLVGKGLTVNPLPTMAIYVKVA